MYVVLWYTRGLVAGGDACNGGGKLHSFRHKRTVPLRVYYYVTHHGGRMQYISPLFYYICSAITN